MPNLTRLQKVEQFKKYMNEHKVNFGSTMANERAEEMFVHAMSLREDLYLHTIAEFKDAYSILLKNTWDEQYKYLSNKIEK